MEGKRRGTLTAAALVSDKQRTAVLDGQRMNWGPQGLGRGDQQ